MAYFDTSEKSLHVNTPLTDQKGHGVQGNHTAKGNKSPFFRTKIGVIVIVVNIEENGI